MEMKLTPSQQAALATDKHIILTANAGSGKTATLTRRMLEIMTTMEPFDIHSIVAITFTELAASELFHKVQKAIDEDIEKETDHNRLKRLFEIKSSLVNANISTIHSFCLNLLKEFPLESNLDAQVQIIDKFTQDEFMSASIRTVINSWFEEEEKKNDIRFIYRLFLNKAALISALRECLEKRYLFSSTPFNIIDRGDIAAFQQMYTAYANEMLTGLISKREYDELSAFARIACNTSSVPDFSSPLEFLNFLYTNRDIIFTKKYELRGLNKISEKNNLDASLLAETAEKIKEFVSADPANGVQDLFRFNRIFFSMVKDVLTEYERKKRMRSYLDFEDMQIYTRELIAIEEVRNILANRFKYILVDEYQDTNDLQYEIILPLLEQLKKNNLFVVGDDKQSIYAFRGADLAVFEKTRDDIKKVDETGNLTLAESFRMTPQLCGFVNKLFRTVFGHSPEKKFNEIAYKETIAGIPLQETSKPGTRITDTKIELITAESTQAQADLLVNRLIALYKEYNPTGMFSFSDIAILVPRHEDMTPLRKALTAKDVPFTTIGGRGFFKTQIVLDMLNYLEFLAYPESDTALTGLLKSPFFNYSDQDLLLLFENREGGMFEHLKKLAGVNEREHQTLTVLSVMQKFALNSKPFDVLLRITKDNDLLSVMAARSNGDQIIADYNKLVDMSFVYSSTGIRNLPEFVRYIKNAYEEDKDESNADISAGREAVTVMTIHKSKGLQYKAVFLFDSGAPLKHKAPDFTVTKELGFLKKLRPPKMLEDLSISFIQGVYNAVEKKKALAEHHRKFYVAVTRAANFLFFVEHKTAANSFSYYIRKVFGESITGEIKETVEIYNPASEPKNYKETLSIPLVYVQEIPEELMPEQNSVKVETGSDYDVTPLPELSKTENFSASQFASYVFCPVQFFLQYRLSMGILQNDRSGKLIENEESEHSADVNEEEEITTPVKTNYASGFGTFIHDLLSDERYKSGNEEQIRKRISAYLPVDKMSEDELRSFSGRTLRYLNAVANSAYNNLTGILSREQEVQLICSVGDTMFEGRIDLLVETDNAIIIADYKTNLVNEQSVEEKVAQYRPQMDYYAWLVNKVRNSKGKLLKTYLHFLHLNKEYVFEYDAAAITQTEKLILEMLNSTATNSYEKHPDSCAYCRYSTDGIHCVVPGTIKKD